MSSCQQQKCLTSPIYKFYSLLFQLFYCILFSNRYLITYLTFCFFKLEFTLPKAEQPLQSMELQEIEDSKNEKPKRLFIRKSPNIPLTVELKQLRSKVEAKHSASTEFQSLAVRENKLLTQTSL